MARLPGRANRRGHADDCFSAVKALHRAGSRGRFEISKERGRIGSAIVAHKDVKAFVHGGTKTARDRTRRSSYVQKLSLELGGTNPNIILPTVTRRNLQPPSARLLKSGRDACAGRGYLSIGRCTRVPGFSLACHAIQVGDPLNRNDVGAMSQSRILKR